MATASSNEDYRCMYCCQPLSVMEDPRQLPCQHVSCLSCITNDRSQDWAFKCPLCKSSFANIDLNELPKPSVDKKNIQEGAEQKQLQCERPKCQADALRYCIDCGSRFCMKHQEAHRIFFANEHKEVSIHAYERSPELFGKPLCETHGEDLIKACRKCDKLICIECDFTESCEGAEDLSQHDFASFSAINKSVDEEYDGFINSAETRVTKMCELEKEAWSDLETKEELCQKKITEIELFRKHQLQIINKETEKAIKDVERYMEEATAHVEVFSGKMFVQREQLEEFNNNLKRLRKDAHTCEKIKRRRSLSSQACPDLDKGVSCCKPIRSVAVIAKDLEATISSYIIKVPSSITLNFKSRVFLDIDCWSARHTGNGDMVIGTSSGIRHLARPNLTLMKYPTSHKLVADVVAYGRNIFILHERGTTCIVEMCLPGLTQRLELFRYTKQLDKCESKMAVNDHYLVVNNYETKSLIIYNFYTKTSISRQPTIYPFDLYFLPDGCLLGGCRKKLVKYSLEIEGLSLVWTLDGFDNGGGVCADGDGLIYVCKDANSCLSAITPDGKILQEIYSREFPLVSGTLSIQGRELVISSSGDRKLYFYELKTS